MVLLYAAELLQRGAIPSHTPVRFHLHLKGASQRVGKFIRPKPGELAPREEHERLLLVHRLLDPLEAGWQAARSMGDVDWAFPTTEAEKTLLGLACPDITLDFLRGGPPHRWPLHTCPGAGGPTNCFVWCASTRNSGGTPGASHLPPSAHPAGQGPLRNIFCWLQRPARGVGAAPGQLHQAWPAL